MIRPATMEDIDTLLDLAEEFYALTDMADIYSFNRKSTRFLLKAFIETPDAVLLVAEIEGCVIGGIGGQLMPATYNFDKKMMFENFWFIGNDYRGKCNPLKMLKAFEKASKDLGACMILMGAYHHLKFNALTALYGKAGYSPTETIFIKEV